MLTFGDMGLDTVWFVDMKCDGIESFFSRGKNVVGGSVC